MTYPSDRTDDEWRALLSPEAYAVLRKHATERPGSSALNHHLNKTGTYCCAGCGQALFTQAMKYDSGTGWPSFFDCIPASLAFRRDWSMILPRREYHCACCGGHQGHVFGDGPRPTGKRYCNNGVALRFVADPPAA